MSLPLAKNSVRQEFITELESILESDEAYGSNLQILTYALKEDVINGKFKDSWNNRVYEFIIDLDGISYKPAAKLDSVFADDLPARFDAFSEGYASLFDGIRLDRNPMGKRVKKPKCGAEGYGCGFSCIGLLKTCRILSSGKKAGTNKGTAIGQQRINKLLAKAAQLMASGDQKGSELRKTIVDDLKASREKHTEAGKTRMAQRKPIETKTEEKIVFDKSLSNKEFTVLNNTETREKLNQWIEVNTELNKLRDSKNIKRLDEKRIQAATDIIENLFDMMEDENANFGGIVDSKGNLQSAYISKETPNGYYVDFLASAPWNCLPDHPNKKTGAGASAIEALVKDAISKKEGQIELFAVLNAVPFYEKIGFKRKQDKSLQNRDLILNKENAMKFLEEQNKKNRQDTNSVSTTRTLTELEILEEQALGLFSIPRERDHVTTNKNGVYSKAGGKA